ncbi:restriction endonuclease subunit S [Fusibacter bizertensis]|uniref:Restriction endonuclease subunit S n=1 Tax=Fusibacter bizertensis TaxID=1488331 RepID=A0ABT6N8K1_9FIRM|nr:restriction endonuclease subunit S [Fusibacter bizertensis]MDH8676733.1 restriction endonuclease subunit S [Fusibacter bizertensis]
MKYKESIVGFIPDEWDEIEINELIKMGIIEGVLDGNHGAIHPTSADYVDKGIPFIMANNLGSGKVDLENCKFITVDLSKTLMKGFAKTGDVLLTHKGTIGETAIVPEVNPYIVLTPQVTYYRISNCERLDNKYLKYYFDQENYQSMLTRLSAQSTRAYIGITQQKKLSIVIPPLPEQKKIAMILSTVDGHIDEVDGMIEDLKELKKGLMQKLLTEGIGHTEFKDSEVGRIPVEWEVKTLDEVAEFFNGKGHEKNVSEDGHYIIVNSKFISTEGEVIKRSDECLFPLIKGDVTMVMSDVPNGKAIAKTYLIEEDNKYTLNQRICCLRTNDMDSRFLSYITSRNLYFLKFDDGNKQTNLRKSEVLDFKLQVPPFKEQKMIADILDSLQNHIVQYESLLFQTKELKKGLMQHLLTGKKRVTVNE